MQDPASFADHRDNEPSTDATNTANTTDNDNKNHPTANNITTMCPRNINTYFLYDTCGHTIPIGACTKYAPKLHQCLGDPVSPKVFHSKEMRCGGKVNGNCKFCRMGKDPSGDFAHGEMWEDAAKYRKG